VGEWEGSGVGEWEGSGVSEWEESGRRWGWRSG
jgi:hypothetical protein